MESYIKRIGTNSIIISILLVIVSLLMIFKPLDTIDYIIILFGYVLVVDGLIHFASYFRIKDEYRYFSYELAQAIIDIILGFLIVCNVDSVMLFLPIVLGIWIILNGILKVQLSLNIRGSRNTNWGIMFFMSLVSIALGVGIIFHPDTTLNVIVKLSGLILLFTQIIDIYNDVYFLNQFKKIDKTVKKKAEKATTSK